MSNKYFGGVVENKGVEGDVDADFKKVVLEAPVKAAEKMDKLRVADAITEIFALFKRSNKYIDETMPWALAKDETQQDRLATVLYNLIEAINIGASLLEPFMPETSAKILAQINGAPRAFDDMTEFGKYQSGNKVVEKPEILFARMDQKEVMEKVKEIAPKTEEINILYITNEKKQLVGTVSLRELLVAQNYDTLQDIMEDNVISVEPETDQEDVARLVSKYDLHAIPVVNKRMGIIGIITVDDIIDVIEEENTEDMLKLGGVNKEEDVDSSALESVHMRLPWLLVNLVPAFLASATVSMFEDTISQVVALAASMPIVAGMGGNAATQTLAVVIRGIAIGDIKLHGNEKRILKSIFVGFMNGMVCGILAAFVVSYMYGNPYLGVIILVAMVANMMIAAFVGFVIPVVLKACHADPAVASSIFITTFTDVCGFFIFLGLAKISLPYLIR